MNTHPIRATVDGDTVTMRRAEFERLVALLDEAEEVAAFDTAQRRLAAGDDERVPASVVDRLLAGESPVRVWSEHRGLSGEVVAEAVGMTLPEFMQIETGRREPTLTELKALGAVLGVGLDDLV